MNTHRDLCKIAATWLLDQVGIDLVSWELKYNRGYVDAIGITSGGRKTPRLVAVEVKRTRADLLADLRKKKLLKYENHSSHCYLAATTEALGIKRGKVTRKDAVANLRARGLPKYWGVLLLPTSGPGPVVCLASARPIRAPHRRTLQALTRKIAKSFMYRIMSSTSPMEEQKQ